MGMINEDAIKWLENLKQDIGQLRHEDLWPYAQAIDEIIAMLEEQEPKSALSNRVCEVEPFRYVRKGFCPKCHQEMEWLFNRKHCGFCGQAVKWE